MKTAPPDLLPIFRSKGQARLLTAIFVDAPQNGSSLADLERATGLSAASVHTEVERLEAAGLVTSDRRGRARYVSANRSSPYYAALHQLLVTAFGPDRLLADRLDGLSGVEEAFIFGSYARRFLGEPGPPPGDVDVLVVGDPDIDAIYAVCLDVESETGLLINPTVVSRAEFDKGDGFLRTVRDGPRLPVVATES